MGRSKTSPRLYVWRIYKELPLVEFCSPSIFFVQSFPRETICLCSMGLSPERQLTALRHLRTLAFGLSLNRAPENRSQLNVPPTASWRRESIQPPYFL